MRNLEQIEKLSSSAGLGLWAEDVILALDRVTRLGQRADEDLALLEDAAEILDAALKRSSEPLATNTSARALAAGDTALQAAEVLADSDSPDKTQDVLRKAAASLREVTAGQENGVESQATTAISLFAAVGRHQLGESNSVLAGT